MGKLHRTIWANLKIQRNGHIYTRDVYILGQFVNVQKSFFAFGFTKCISYVDKLKVLFIIIEQINTNNDQAKPKQKKNNG